MIFAVPVAQPEPQCEFILFKFIAFVFNLSPLFTVGGLGSFGGFGRQIFSPFGGFGSGYDREYGRGYGRGFGGGRGYGRGYGRGCHRCGTPS